MEKCKIVMGSIIMRKILSAFICFVMVFGISANSVVTAEGIEMSGQVGSNLFWQYDGNGTLIISGDGAMEKLEVYPWDEIESDIELLVVKEGCTSLSSCSFWMCSNLIAAVLPKTLKKIDDSTFECCEHLYYIYYSGTEAEWNLVEKGMDNFYMCEPTASYNYVEDDFDDIKISIRGTMVETDQPPVVVDGRTLAPVRAIFENLGYTVSWDGTTQTVTASKKISTFNEEYKTIILKIGSNEMHVDGEVTYLDVAAQIINGRTLIPVRAVAEADGYYVHWIPIIKLVYLDFFDYFY